MSAASPIDPIAERVERLLVRYEETRRTNQLLIEQVEGLVRERDALRGRLASARSRIDALLERLPAEAAQDADAADSAHADAARAPHTPSQSPPLP